MSERYCNIMVQFNVLALWVTCRWFPFFNPESGFISGLIVRMVHILLPVRESWVFCGRHGPAFQRWLTLRKSFHGTWLVGDPVRKRCRWELCWRATWYGNGSPCDSDLTSLGLNSLFEESSENRFRVAALKFFSALWIMIPWFLLKKGRMW